MKSLSAVDLTSPKLPPQNVEAEQSVLGAILFNFALCFVNTNIFRTSAGIVIGCEMALIGVTLAPAAVGASTIAASLASRLASRHSRTWALHAQWPSGERTCHPPNLSFRIEQEGRQEGAHPIRRSERASVSGVADSVVICPAVVGASLMRHPRPRQ